MKKNSILKKLKNDINEFFRVSIENGTRTGIEVYARSIYYKLYRTIDPAITLEKIGKTVNKDHSTVVYGLKRFEQDYLYDKKFKFLYDSFILNYPEYLQEIYLKKLCIDVHESLTKTINFVCELEVQDRKKFIDELETLKRLFINDVKLKLDKE